MLSGKVQERVWVGHIFDIANFDVGKRFAEIEFVACLAMIIQKWSVHLKEGWTVQMVWDVVNASEEVLLIRPISDIPLVCRKRG